jgi:hypothetical protein
MYAKVSVVDLCYAVFSTAVSSLVNRGALEGTALPGLGWILLCPCFHSQIRTSIHTNPIHYG